MNTNKNIKIAEDYYKSMAAQGFDAMAEFLHESVELFSPLAHVPGKSAVVEAAKGFASMIKGIDIKSKFASKNQVMMAYDFSFNNGFDMLEAAVLMDFNNNKITRIQLFYDARPFVQKKDEIFGN